MNDREREICARVKEFREHVDWSQKDFAAQLGISLNQLASIEYARTPLRYDIAWKLRTLFGLSLEWLSVGELMPNSVVNDNLPAPQSTGLTAFALLSEVSDKVHGPTSEIHHAKKKGRKLKIDKAELSHRAFIAYGLREQIDVWVSKVPDGYTADFADKFFQLVKAYLQALPIEPDEMIEARMDALLWDKMRRDLRGRLPRAEKEPKKDLAGAQDKCKTYVDNRENTDSLSGMRSAVPKWSELKKSILRLTSRHGGKAALAKEAGVSRQVLGNWLSDDSHGTPNADHTLWLFRWVQKQQERQ